jgi:O-antigen/teichoic acid export membrane protein
MKIKPGKTMLTAVTSYGSAFSLLATSLITIRLATHGLGKEEFGAWSFVFSTIGYFFLFDFGLSSSMARVFGEPMATRNSAEVGRWASMCFLVMAAQAVVMLVAGALLRDWVLGFSAVQGPLRAEMENLWDALLWIRVLSHPASVLPALLFAQNRVYVQNVIYAVSGWFSVAGFYVALEKWHWGLQSYAVLLGVSTGSTVLLWLISLLRGPVPLHFTLRRLPWDGFGKMMKFSSGVFAAQLSVQATGLTQNVIITSILGLDAAAIFAVTSRLPMFLGTFVFRPFAAFAPRWQEFYCNPETKDRWKGEFVTLLRFSNFFGAAAATGLLAANLSFVGWWTKPEYAAVPLVNIFLAVVLVTQVLVNCSGTVFQNYYKLGGYATAKVIGAVIEIGLGIVLAKAIGIAGIPLASAIPGALMVMYAFRSAGKLMGMRLFRTIVKDCFFWGPGFAMAAFACYEGFPVRLTGHPFQALFIAGGIGTALALPAIVMAGWLMWRLKKPA